MLRTNQISPAAITAKVIRRCRVLDQATRVIGSNADKKDAFRD